jgi:hypothetical protein
MKYGLVLSLLIAIPCMGQTKATGEAKTAGPCSPAVTGSNNKFQITCKIDEKQGQKMVDILNRILSNQLDPDTVMAKLEEINNGVKDLQKEVNPYAPKILYDFQGNQKIISEGGTHVEANFGAEANNFQKIKLLYASKDWMGLKDFCAAQMEKTPDWMTPVLFAGIAYANLGNKQKAIELLTIVNEKIGDQPGYSDTAIILEKLQAQPMAR